MWESKIFDGEWVRGSADDRIVVEPATGKQLTTVGMATPDDVATAATKASAAQKDWAARPYNRTSHRSTPRRSTVRAVRRRNRRMGNPGGRQHPDQGRTGNPYRCRRVLQRSSFGRTPRRRGAALGATAAELLSSRPRRHRRRHRTVQLPDHSVDPCSRSRTGTGQFGDPQA